MNVFKSFISNKNRIRELQSQIVRLQSELASEKAVSDIWKEKYERLLDKCKHHNKVCEEAKLYKSKYNNLIYKIKNLSEDI